ncbi:efflux transporter periplasmic adaptor subunit, partial [Escherichia coli]|nr:efflux transporter periplasmic adaptor subunit [Escherichia coli]
MKIKVEISEGDIYQVQPGQQAIFTISGNPDKYYSAIVKTVYPASINTADNSKSSSSNSY